MTDIKAAPRRWVVTVDDVPIRILDDISVSESMSNLTTVLEFGLAQRGGSLPARGNYVIAKWIDIHGETSTDVFGGFIDAIEIESSPWSYRCRCTDQLSKLRRTKSGSDMDLTGLTDGEAWKAIADYCGITYDDDDIADMGYVLGVRAPILWISDGSTPASQIIKELDDIFQCHTLTIGNGRVIRHHYDPYPSSGAFAYASYTRGSSIRLQGLHRTIGGSDSIQNVWRVTGATIESEDGSCSTTPWALARDGNEELGSRHIRISEQSITSDLIQDESLAIFIATWKMGETNRVSETGSMQLFNDAQIRPGSVVGIIDTTPGMDAESARWCLVTSVERAGFGMTLQLTAGPPGEVGTLTHGMNLVCNDSSGDGGGADDGFDPPDPDPFPGTDPDLSWDEPDDGLEVGDDSDTTPIDVPVVCDDTDNYLHVMDGIVPQSYWRSDGPATWAFVTPDGSPATDGSELVMRLTGGSGGLILTSNPDTTTQSSADDVVYPANSVVSFCAEIAICGDDTEVELALIRNDTKVPFNTTAEWYAEPDGISATDGVGHHYKFTGKIKIPNGGSVTTNFNHPPSSISGGGLNRNTGLFFPFPPPGDGVATSGPGTNPDDYDFFTICASWDLSGEYQDGWVFGEAGEGHNTSEVCLTPGCVGGALHYTPNTRDFNLEIFGVNIGWSGGDCPPLQVRAAAVGSGTCDLNPDYQNPWDRD